MEIGEVIQLIVAAIVVAFGLKMYSDRKYNQKRNVNLRQKELDFELKNDAAEIDDISLRELVRRSNERTANKKPQHNGSDKS